MLSGTTASGQSSSQASNADSRMLRFAPADLLRLIEAANKRDRQADGHTRVHTRYRSKTKLAMIRIDVLQNDSQSRSILTLMRNLSRSGAGVLHTAYAHVGTTVELNLVDTQKTLVKVKGKVVRCEHLDGVVYELGIRFDSEIDVRCFAAAEPLIGQYSIESVCPSTLSGSISLISGHPLTTELVRKFCADTNVKVHVPAPEAHLVPVAGSCPIIDLDVVSDWPSIARAWAANGAPMLVMTSNLTPSLAGQLRAAGVGVTIVKPLDQNKFLRALAEVLIVGFDEASGGAVRSNLAGTPEWDPLITECVAELNAFAAEGAQLLKTGNFAALRGRSMNISAAAGSVGFLSIHQAAKCATRLVECGGTPEQMRDAFGTLLSLCTRARADAA